MSLPACAPCCTCTLYPCSFRLFVWLPKFPAPLHQVCSALPAPLRPHPCLKRPVAPSAAGPRSPACALCCRPSLPCLRPLLPALALLLAHSAAGPRSPACALCCQPLALLLAPSAAGPRSPACVCCFHRPPPPPPRSALLPLFPLHYDITGFSSPVNKRLQGNASSRRRDWGVMQQDAVRERCSAKV